MWSGNVAVWSGKVVAKLHVFWNVPKTQFRKKRSFFRNIYHLIKSQTFENSPFLGSGSNGPNGPDGPNGLQLARTGLLHGLNWPNGLNRPNGLDGLERPWRWMNPSSFLVLALHFTFSWEDQQRYWEYRFPPPANLIFNEENQQRY